MGLFDSMCCESGLIIDNTWSRRRFIKPQRLIPIRETAPGTWVPIAMPLVGTNDRGGSMDIPGKLDGNMKAFAAFGKTLVYTDADNEWVQADLAKGLSGVLAEIRGDGGGAKTTDGHRVSFSLIHGPVFEAIVEAVRSDSPTAWRRYAQLGLATPEPPLPNRGKTKARRASKLDPEIKKLATALLDDPADDGTRRVFVDCLLEREDPRGHLLSLLPAAAKLPWTELAAIAFPAGSPVYDGIPTATLKSFRLVDFVRFLAWGTTLLPAYSEGQFTGYTALPNQGGVEPYTERAREKYAGMPELLAACDANERSFRERGKQTDHPGD